MWLANRKVDNGNIRLIINEGIALNEYCPLWNAPKSCVLAVDTPALVNFVDRKVAKLCSNQTALNAVAWVFARPSISKVYLQFVLLQLYTYWAKRARGTHDLFFL